MSKLALLCALGACTTSESHSLVPVPPAPPLPPEQRADCTIGVAGLIDDTGIDFGPDLRDYLRAYGPCRDVVLVFGDDKSSADVVISGTARARMNREPLTREMTSGAIWTGIGLGMLLNGLIFSIPSPDPKDPADVQSTDRTLNSIGTACLEVGAVATLTGAIVFLVDAKHNRAVVVHGKIDADIAIAPRHGDVERFTLSDEVTARRHHSGDRPEGRFDTEAAGPLYREFYARIFDDITGRVQTKLRENVTPRARM